MGKTGKNDYSRKQTKIVSNDPNILVPLFKNTKKYPHYLGQINKYIYMNYYGAFSKNFDKKMQKIKNTNTIFYKIQVFCISISFSSQKAQNKKDWKIYRSIIYTTERPEIQSFLKQS